ncbi:hypothetical protein RMSM_00442 [Rhodopirellula maiorica SM1]|uniref:Uncharacterized protein n=1 Tax=Rhodopirellula maiorica SM1 TaxID=1265738 RepID=M5S8Y5_9BACT|nr:hypothetical protein RMSM_00442 [Rhodopirellula maiorica SM1]
MQQNLSEELRQSKSSERLGSFQSGTQRGQLSSSAATAVRAAPHILSRVNLLRTPINLKTTHRGNRSEYVSIRES